MKNVKQSLVNEPKWNVVKKWIKCCWEGRINNEEVSGNKENKEKDNEKGSPK